MGSFKDEVKTCLEIDMQDGVISCVILNYNDAETTKKLLDCIKDYQILDYIVVVDNCSSDNSYLELQHFCSEKIHLIKADYNGGYGAGNNLGLRYSFDCLKADYALIANPDVFFDEECVWKLIQSFKECSSVAVVSAKQSNSPDCAWKDCNTLQYILATSLFFEIWLNIRSYMQEYFKGLNSVSVYAVPGSFLMIDLKKMLEHGMYDEDFFLYCEEFVLAQKFAEAGLKTILRLDCSYIHNHHVSISKTYHKWSQQHKILLKSTELFLKKYKHAKAWQLFLAKIWFMYTKMEFMLYDIFCSIRSWKK